MISEEEFNKKLIQLWGGRVKTVRDTMSQRRFAQELGVGQCYISEIETGKTKPSLEFCLKLSDWSGISLDALLKSEGDGGGIEPPTFPTTPDPTDPNNIYDYHYEHIKNDIITAAVEWGIMREVIERWFTKVKKPSPQLKVVA